MINGVSVAQAIREELVVGQDEEEIVAEEDLKADDDNSMFVPETKNDEQKVVSSNPFDMFKSQPTSLTPATSVPQANASSMGLLDHPFRRQWQ